MAGNSEKLFGQISPPTPKGQIGLLSNPLNLSGHGQRMPAEMFSAVHPLFLAKIAKHGAILLRRNPK